MFLLAACGGRSPSSTPVVINPTTGLPYPTSTARPQPTPTRTPAPPTPTPDSVVSSPQWMRQFGSTGFDDVTALDVDASGNVYAVGTNAAPLTGELGTGIQDSFVRKYNASGALLWSRTIGTDGKDNATSVLVTPQGLIYVSGRTIGAFEWFTNPGGTDAFIAAYSPDGALVWLRQFGSNENDEATETDVDSAGDLYVIGYSSGAFPGVADIGNEDIFVRKYSSAGEVLWTRQIAGEDHDSPGGIVVDRRTGTVYVAGALTPPHGAGAGEPGLRPFLSAYDPQGTELWTSSFGAVQERDDAWVTDLALAGGNLYSLGYINGEFETTESLGGSDVFLRKFTLAGSTVWARQFGSELRDEGSAFHVDNDGTAYVVAYARGVVEGAVAEGDAGAEAGVFIRKYGADGFVRWTRQFLSTAFERAYAIAKDDAGNIYFGGSTQREVEAGMRAGGEDAFIIKVVETRFGGSGQIR